MFKYKIRRLEPKDIASAVRLIGQSLGDYDFKSAKSEVRNIFRKSAYKVYRFVDTFVIESDGKVIGYGGIWAMRCDPKTFAMTDWLAIDEDYRRMGLGTTLMRFLFRRAKSKGIKHIYVETSADNRLALGFYKKCKFKRLCSIPNYYDESQDLVMLLKTLK